MQLTALWLVCIAPAQGEVVDRIAAVVEKDVITLSEVYALGGEFIENAAQGGPMDRLLSHLNVLILLHPDPDSDGMLFHIPVPQRAYPLALWVPRRAAARC